MKKNLFILFSVYFFVVQAVLAGILRSEPKFFWLGMINLVALIVLMVFYHDKDTQAHTIEKQKHPTHETKPTFREQIPPVAKKEHKKKSELVFPSIVSFLLAAGVFLMFSHNTTSFVLLFLFSLSIGFIIFISLTLLWKHRIKKSFRSLLGTKIYVGVLIIGVVFTGYEYYQTHTTYDVNFSDYLAHNFLGKAYTPPQEHITEETGMVLGSGLGETGTIDDIYSDVFSGNTLPEETETGVVLGSSQDEKTTTTSSARIGNHTLMDAVIYLLEKNKTPLVTSKDMTFTYVTTSNPYYTERRTAYANKLIGKTTNPSKYIVCESYIVMKGLLEKRNVVYTSTNVLDKFRTEAVKRDALNGCVKGKIVTDKTL